MVLYFLLLFIASASVHMVHLPRITNFYVPRKGTDQVAIDCKYDLEGQKLYDVKWYKDGQQFFGCAGDGTVHEYPVEGVMIRHSGSASIGACPLTLIALTAQSAGEYKCEITLDTDGFPMDWRSGRLDLQLAQKKSITDLVPKGSEKHTSHEEVNEISGCGVVYNYNFVILLIMWCFILT